jgi:hypothetical protein
VFIFKNIGYVSRREDMYPITHGVRHGGWRASFGLDTEAARLPERERDPIPFIGKDYIRLRHLRQQSLAVLMRISLHREAQ